LPASALGNSLTCLGFQPLRISPGGRQVLLLQVLPVEQEDPARSVPPAVFRVVEQAPRAARRSPATYSCCSAPHYPGADWRFCKWLRPDVDGRFGGGNRRT